MTCLDCHPDDNPAVAVCARCGAGVCREHLVESDEYLTFVLPVDRPVPAFPPTRRLRCQRCAAAEAGQRERHAA